MMTLLFYMILVIPIAVSYTHLDQTVKRAGKGPTFQSKEIYLILLFAFAMQFGINYYSAFLGVYLLELGYSQSLLGVLNCISVSYTHLLRAGCALRARDEA